MKITSRSIQPDAAIDPRYAAGKPVAQSIVTFSDNISPHLAWSDAPAGTRSFALIVHDRSVPSRGDDVNKPDREVPSDLARTDFFHWVLIDLPASLREVQEGEFSGGVTPHGKPGPETLHGARHGLNDYTGWFAEDANMRGDWYGYDGPFPPFNDALVHRYVFTVFALDADKLEVPYKFTGQDVRRAMTGHVLDQASFEASYTLNKRLL